MSGSLYNIGLSALNAAQAGILTTGHNIANASTPGFTRQQVVDTTNTPLASGGGFFGQGVAVETVKRVYSAALSDQLLSAQNGAAEMTSYQAQISQIGTLLSDPTAGLTPALSTFFNGVQQVAANPSDTPSRQALLSGAQSLVSTFQSLDQQLSAIRTGANAQISNEVSVINSYAQQIATANQSVIMAQGGTGQPANDLLDQRDQLISQLNQEIKVSTVTQNDGTYTVFIGNGQPLVVGNQAATLLAVPAPDEPQKVNVALQGGANSTPITLQESMLSGGTLGGLLSFRSQSLDATENALGRIALAVAQTFNDQHVLGQDLNGAPGGKFFNVPTPVVSGSSLNAGTATLSAQIYSSNYRLDVTGGNYVVTRLSDGSNVGTFAPTAFPVTVDGITLSLGSGATTNGDSFVVQPGNPAGSRVIASSGNAAGAASPDSTASNVQSLEGSDYRLSYVATNTFTLTRLSDNTAWTANGTSIATALTNLAGMHQTGVSLSFSGTPTVGDSFLIQPTRTAASSISVAINDPGSIAVAAPIRSATGTTNMGNANISAPTVYDKSSLPLAATVTLTYSNGVFVVGGAVPAVSEAIAYPATITQGTSTGSAAPLTTSLLIDSAGSNNQFTVALDGTSATVTIPQAVPAESPATTSYSIDTLATAIQTAINGAPGITGTGHAVTVSVVSGKLQVTSNKVGSGSSVALSANGANTGYANLFGTPTRVDGTTAVTNAIPINFNGMSFSISGTPQNGDTFTVDNNTGGVSDNSNALLLGKLQTQNTLAATPGGSATASYLSAYSQIVSQVGNKAREVQVTGQGLQSLTTQAQTARDSASAVNLDEEAANLMQYQQAYQAAAKVITVAGKLFDTLLAI